jgi:hypothetical protein
MEAMCISVPTLKYRRLLALYRPDRDGADVMNPPLAAEKHRMQSLT